MGNKIKKSENTLTAAEWGIAIDSVDSVLSVGDDSISDEHIRKWAHATHFTVDSTTTRYP